MKHDKYPPNSPMGRLGAMLDQQQVITVKVLVQANTREEAVAQLMTWYDAQYKRDAVRMRYGIIGISIEPVPDPERDIDLDDAIFLAERYGDPYPGERIADCVVENCGHIRYGESRYCRAHSRLSQL